MRTSVIGIVPEEKWSSWWTSARKNPQIVISGSGAKATYGYSTSTGEAEKAIKRDFERADAKSKLELARKHSARSKEIADFFSAQLAADAARLARSDPATAWQILATLETLPGAYAAPLDPASLLGGPLASRVVAAIGDKSLRERALQNVRQAHPDWPKVYSETFFLDDEPRILSLVVDALEKEGHTEVRDRLIDETLRYPRRHPRAFYWFARQLNDQQTLSDKANYALLFQILDAISSDEFSSVRARLKAELGADSAQGIRTAARTMVNEVGADSLKIYEGKLLTEIAKMRGQDAYDAAFDILIGDQGRTSAIYFSFNEDALRYAMKQPWVSVGQDAGAVSPDSTGQWRERGHPRGFGTFPRILGRYVRQDSVISLEFAIRKMTSLAAQRVGINDRGLLKPGMYADITVFDPATIIDRATFEQPSQLATGVTYVFVNGVPVVDNGQPTAALPGRALRGPGYTSRR